MNPPPYGRSQQIQAQQQPYGMVNSPASGAYNSPAGTGQMVGGSVGGGKPGMHPQQQQQQQSNLQGGMRPIQQQQQQSQQQQIRGKKFFEKYFK